MSASDSDLISHEMVESWTIEALKEFCKLRGYKCTGTKKELVSRVYFLYNNQTPELPGTKEVEMSKKKDYQKLHNMFHSSPDPLKLQKWISEQEGMRSWPAISYVDIDWFMRQNGSVGLTREVMTAYKTGKAFSYFSCDWLREIYYSPISKHHSCCYLKTTCVPSNRLNDPPHAVWVKVIKKTGEIVSAFCSCMAG